MAIYKKILLISSLLFLLVACATVPITGRSQLNMIPDQQLIASSEANFSQLMSNYTKKSILLLPSESPQAEKIVTMVNRVSERIIDASGLKNSLKWEIIVVKARNQNAFVLPNGKIVVYMGILPITKTEAGLAAIIGHEVSHVVAHHAAERISQILLNKMALDTANLALAVSIPQYQPLISAGLGIGAQYGIILPFSRKHESEADHIGLLLMAKAGYDPAEAVGVWERMKAMSGSGPQEFMSTHPSHQTRIADIREWVPEANLYYADRTRPLPSRLSEIQEARAEQSSRMALAPIASQPSFQLGFWYQSKMSNRPNPITYRFDRKEECSVGECMVIKAETGDFIFTKDYGLVEVRRPDGSWIRYSPPMRIVLFPLRVGDSWTEELVFEDSSGRRNKARLKGDVVSYESVTVPSGSFMAFKTIASLGGVRFQEAWYAPETRTFVRSVTYRTKGDPIVTELMDYQKTEEPAGAMNTDPE